MELLSTEELAARWGKRPDTLKNWRFAGQGPNYLKLGSRVLYRMADVLDYEQRQLVQVSQGR